VSQAKAAEEAELRTTPEGQAARFRFRRYGRHIRRSCSQRLGAGGGILIIYANVIDVRGIINASGERGGSGGAGSDGVSGVNGGNGASATEAATAPGAAAAAESAATADTADTAAAAAQEALYFFPLQ